MELQLTFNPYPFISLTCGVFVLIILIYMLRLQQKTAITWHFVGICASLFLLQAVLFLTNITTFWGRAFWPLQLVCGMFCGFFMLQFINHFPQCDHPKKAARGSRIFIALISLGFGYVPYYAYQTLTQPWSLTRKPDLFFLLLTPFAIVVLLSALLYRIGFYAKVPMPTSQSRASWSAYGRALALALIHSPTPPVRVFRNLLLANMLALLPAIAPILGLSFLANLYLVTFGMIWFTAALALIYFNHATHSVTFLVKIMGISLVSLLTFLGMVGTENIVSAREDHIHHIQLEVLTTQRAIQAGTFPELPLSILYIVELPASADLPNAPAVFIHPAYTPDDVRAFLTTSPISDFLNTHKLLADSLPQIRTYLLAPNTLWVKYLGYRFTDHTKQYEIGISLERYHNRGRGRLLHLMSQVITGCAFVFVVFPLFFHANLIKPLKRLLDGVKQINAGQLDIVVPVEYEDEIGFLTRAFNQMAYSLKISDQQKDTLNIALQQANEQLEDRVQQRTIELRAAKESAEKARQAAEEANRAKSVFLANMSHELRTPLNVVLGFAQVLQRSRELSEEQQEHVQIINRNGEHLLTLINQVLDLSKIEAERMILREQNIDLHRLFADVEDMFRGWTHKKGLHLLVEHDADMPRFVRIDAVKLRQVLINILNNGIKFTDHGTIRLWATGSAQKNEAQGITDRHSLLVEISDTGQGIAAEELDSIFQAFTQTASGQNVHEGTGLGLTISQRFVQLMKGTITVKSERGQGTTFTMTLPVCVVPADEVPNHIPDRHVTGLEPHQRTAGGDRYRILLVDDQPDNRQVFIKMLQSLTPEPDDSSTCIDIREAQNGQEAIRAWESWRPHLIFMDIRMPIMDGYEATRTIRAREIQHRRSPIPILALTASTFEEETSTVLATGCNAFIRKPFREATLFEALAQYLGIRFVYAQTGPQAHAENVLTPAALSTLPTDVRTKFIQALEALDMDSLHQLNTLIRAENAPLAEALEEGIKAYEFEKILSILEQCNA